MGGPGAHIKGNKPDSHRQLLHVFTYVGSRFSNMYVRQI